MSLVKFLKQTKMKKIVFFMLMALPFVFTSCSDDDDDYSTSDLVGSWTYTKSEASEVSTNSKEATQAITEDIEDYYDNVVLTFTSDGKFVVDSKEEGTYTVNGNKLTITGGGEKLESTISISGNELIVYEDETEYYQDEIGDLIDDADDVVIKKVIAGYHYTKK